VDAVGRVIYKGTQAFVDRKLSLELGNVSPGLYLLQLTNSQGSTANVKFVIEK
jgi:hypothetical protein